MDDREMELDDRYVESSVYWVRPEEQFSINSLPSDVLYSIFRIVPSEERRTVVPLVWWA